MEIVVLFLLITINGVFVMSEMAFISARKARLQQWSEEGRAGAAAALKIANEPSHFLSTTQAAMTVITILSGAFGEATLSESLAAGLSGVAWLEPYADRLAFWIVVAAISVFTLILGELVPKRLALLNAEGIASAIGRPMQLLLTAVFPLVRLLSATTDLVLKLIGMRASQEPPVTRKEINLLMEQGTQAGVFEKHQQALVSRVFRLDDDLITSAMTPRVDIVGLDLNAPFDANRQKVLGSAHSRFIVCKDGIDHVVGVVRAKALLDAALESKPFDLASSAAKPLYVPDTLTMIELLEEFKKHRQHLALVVDEYGELQGLATMNDVLETLVGDVATVEDTSQPDIVRRDDGSWLVDGSIAIERFREAIGIDHELSGEGARSVRTLGGFVMLLLGRVPQVGDRVVSNGLRFEVVDMDQKRVDKLLVTRIDAATAA